VTRVEVLADGDRYAGNPAWWADWGMVDRNGGVVRILKAIAKEVKG